MRTHLLRAALALPLLALAAWDSGAPGGPAPPPPGLGSNAIEIIGPSPVHGGCSASYYVYSARPISDWEADPSTSANIDSQSSSGYNWYVQVTPTISSGTFVLKAISGSGALAQRTITVSTTGPCYG
jgi:hypothetical protein